MNIYVDIACLSLGSVLGVIGGMLGIGGGILAVPIITYLFDIDHLVSQGTALIMVVPNVFLSYIKYYQYNKIDNHSTIKLCLISSLVSFISSQYTLWLEPEHMQRYYSIFLVFIIIYQLISKYLPSISLNQKYISIVGVACGLVSGFFSVGGALIVVPLLVLLFSFSQTKAQGVALALVVPSASAAFFSYSYQGRIDWEIGVFLFIGGILTVSTGVKLAHIINPGLLRALFSSVLMFVVLVNPSFRTKYGI